MRLSRLFALTTLVATLVGGGVAVAFGQQADIGISSPRPGQAVSGVVTITGTAAPPEFRRYELAFGYDGDSTGTWFTFQTAEAPVREAELGRWDTTGISDGLYVVRLRVYTSERAFVEALVRGIRVQNLTPSAGPDSDASATPSGAPAIPEATATSAPTPLRVRDTPAAFGGGQAGAPAVATAPLIALPPAPTPRPTADASGDAGRSGLASAGPSLSALQSAFSAGVQLTIVAFTLLGAYAVARAVGRAIWRNRTRL